MPVTKCVWQHHDRKIELQPVFEYFRSIANVAIRAGVEKNLTSKFKLHYELYYKLRSEFHSKYVYGALECATSKLKLFRKIKRKNPQTKIPYISKNHLILDNQSCKILDGQIRIPVKPKHYCTVKLNHYVLEQLQDAKLGSITITENKLIISYSKEVTQQKPSDFVAVDRNLDNITCADSKGNTQQIDLLQATKIKETYRHVKSNFKRNDVRIRTKIFQKYGTKQKNRVNQLLHKTSKQLVSTNQRIIMENLTGIRKLYRKGNGQGKNYRAKMNSWSFYELQRQIEYKARWLGLPVTYIKAAGTSSKCAECGSKMKPEEHRKMFCPVCNTVVDRDINAAKNILARGTKVVPVGAAGEAIVEESQKPILKVDVAQLSCQPTS